MKKLESSLLNMTVVLTVISVIAGGLLAYVNGVTEGPIREIKEKALADGNDRYYGQYNRHIQ